MNTAAARAPYTSPLRYRQKKPTRTLILKAVASIANLEGARGR